MDKPRSAEELTRHNVELIARMQAVANRDRSAGERVADWVAATVGSWPFIIIQSVILTIWLILNVVAWVHHWDPYPFILLNLALSFQAAYASPIIMMSQNRAARMADHRNQLDLQINMLAEQENTETIRMLRLLCEKAGIQIEGEKVEALEQATRPAHLFKQIEQMEKQAEEKKHEGKKEPP